MILLVAAILGGVAQALADKIQIGTLLLTSLALLAAVILAAGLTTRTIWLPILSPAGVGTRYRWFATSSFFAVLAGHGFEDRLRRVLDRPAWAETAEFRLQMKTLAFLEACARRTGSCRRCCGGSSGRCRPWSSSRASRPRTAASSCCRR